MKKVLLICIFVILLSGIANATTFLNDLIINTTGIHYGDGSGLFNINESSLVGIPNCNGAFDRLFYNLSTLSFECGFFNITEANVTMKKYVDDQDAILDAKIDSIGNWTNDRVNYYNKTEVYNKTEIDSIINTTNESMKNYTDEQISILDDKVDSIGNWTNDKPLYATLVQMNNNDTRIETKLDSVGNWTNDKVNYYTMIQIDSIFSSIGNWTNDRNNYVNYTSIVGAVGNWTNDKVGYIPYVGATGNFTTAYWINGLFNWTEDSSYLSFNGAILSFSESSLNSTIDNRAVNVGGDTMTGDLKAPHVNSTFNWTENSSYLSFDGNVLSCNDTALSSAIDFPRVYAVYSSNLTQLTSVTTTAYYINYSDIEGQNKITKNNTGFIFINQSGLYKLIFSAIESCGSPNSVMDIWVRINDTDVPRSNTATGVHASGSSVVVVAEFILQLNAGDNVVLMMAGDSTNCGIVATAPKVSPTRPASPSIITTILRLSS